MKTRLILYGASDDAPEAGPIEFGACHRQSSAHALENVTKAIVHRLDRLLVLGFSFIDSGDDVLTVRGGQRDVREFFLERKLNVSSLEVVVVDFDGARD